MISKLEGNPSLGALTGVRDPIFADGDQHPNQDGMAAGVHFLDYRLREERGPTIYDPPGRSGACARSSTMADRIASSQTDGAGGSGISMLPRKGGWQG